MKLYGSHWLLSTLPIWATAFLLYIVTLGMIFVLRDRFEGLFYNTSYSAMLGDGALLAVVLMGGGILQRYAFLPEFFQTGRFHIEAILVAVAVGVTWWSMDHPQQWADVYHHIVIAPIIIYFGITLIPVIYYHGTKTEKIAVFCLVVIWAVLVVYDAKTKRLAQRSYMEGRGIYIKLGPKKI